MQPTRRTWAVAWLAVAAAVAAILFDRPALLAATAGLGAWLVAAAYGFLRTVAAVDDALSVAVSVAPERAIVGEPVAVTLRTAPVSTDATATVRLRFPPSLSTDASPADATVRLLGDVGAETTVPVTAPVAGEFTIPSPAVTVTGPGGFFEQTVTRGPTATLSAVPRHPDDLNLGGSDREAATLEGAYREERRSRGTEPAEIREYVPGETADRIDWNATARLADTYVREFEVESAIEARFVVDARTASRTGRAGETPLDYLREVALGLLELSRDRQDPVGLAVVDDDGVCDLEAPQTRRAGYERIRRRLRSLEADPQPDRRPARSPVGGSASLARRLAVLDRTDGPFVETLSSCLTHRTPLPPDSSPVRAALRTIARSEAGRTVLFTDDGDRRAVRNAVDEARREGGTVLLFLAPTVLFETDALADLPAAYERYREFERFRDDLDAVDGVQVVEVNPGETRRALEVDAAELAA
jgi:uncharacterized protein (DUF58 family)